MRTNTECRINFGKYHLILIRYNLLYVNTITLIEKYIYTDLVFSYPYNQ